MDDEIEGAAALIAESLQQRRSGPSIVRARRGIGKQPRYRRRNSRSYAAAVTLTVTTALPSSSWEIGCENKTDSGSSRNLR